MHGQQLAGEGKAAQILDARVVRISAAAQGAMIDHLEGLAVEQDPFHVDDAAESVVDLAPAQQHDVLAAADRAGVVDAAIAAGDVAAG